MMGGKAVQRESRTESGVAIANVGAACDASEVLYRGSGPQAADQKPQESADDV